MSLMARVDVEMLLAWAPWSTGLIIRSQHFNYYPSSVEAESDCPYSTS